MENLRRCSIQISITDRCVLFLFGCVRVRVALESAIEIQACLLLTQVRRKSSEVAACCLVNRGQGLELRPSSNLISGWGADHADLETCSRVPLAAALRGVAEWMHPPVADTVLSAQS